MDERVLLAADEFTTFGSTHLAMLAVFVVVAGVLIAVSRARRDEPGVPAFSRAFAVVVPLVTVPLQILEFLPAEWDFDTSLPLQLCDLAWVAATIALWTHRPWATALTYYWGITLTTQGMITPDLASTFPEPRFLMFWVMHMLIVWAALYLTFGRGIGPRWRDYRISCLVTLVWAVGVFAFNVLTGANYGYLNRKPERASALDLLGPWPVYVVFEVLIILAAWALMTWPWVVRARRAAIASSSATTR